MARPGRHASPPILCVLHVSLTRGGLNRNHHHGRFFPQKGTPLAAVLRPSPHGQLEGTPLTDS